MGQPQQTQEHALSPQKGHRTFLLYTLSVSGLGAALFLWALSDLPNHLPDVLVFVAIGILAELTMSEAFVPQVLFSTSFAVYFAVLLLFGPLTSALAAMIGGLVITLAAHMRHVRPTRSPIIQRTLFNMAAYGLALGLGGAVYVVLGGLVGEVSVWTNVFPMLLAAVAVEMVNAALVVGVVSLQTGRSPVQIWLTNVSWATPMNILVMIVGGVGLALGFTIAGLLGIGVYFLPLALTIYAFQMYVRQSKAQVEQLETNIAERERAEEQLWASLKEKEVLLQEIHHRVKNNLQIMSSLLYLQARGVEDKETLHMLMESRNRVRSMALVHEKLYQSADLSKISFAQYVRSLGGHLFLSHGVDPNAIRLESDIDDLYFSIDTAVPCGLIINELVSNSLQHAFPDARPGKVSIDLHADEDGTFLLAVRDDGIGIPEGVGAAEAQSLGLQLVKTLVDQLEGTIEIDRQQGTTVLVTFAELRDRYT